MALRIPDSHCVSAESGLSEVHLIRSDLTFSLWVREDPNFCLPTSVDRSRYLLCDRGGRGDALPFLIATVGSGVDRFQLSFLPQKRRMKCKCWLADSGSWHWIVKNVSSKMHFCRLGVEACCSDPISVSSWGHCLSDPLPNSTSNISQWSAACLHTWQTRIAKNELPLPHYSSSKLFHCFFFSSTPLTNTFITLCSSLQPALCLVHSRAKISISASQPSLFWPGSVAPAGEPSPRAHRPIWFLK